jgi:hypothetical protein
VKVELPESVLKVITAYAERFRVNSATAAQRLMDEIGVAFEGEFPEILGPTWRKVWPSSEPERKPDGKPSVDDGEGPSEEQIVLLERSPNLASGFAGVYAANGGWRGHARGRPLKTRRSPERAAWDRYLFMKENNLPYGNDPVGETVAWLRSRNPHATEEELRREAEEMEALRGGSVPGM